VLWAKKDRNRQNFKYANAPTGDIKKQVGNTVKAVFSTYQFQTIGELNTPKAEQQQQKTSESRDCFIAIPALTLPSSIIHLTSIINGKLPPKQGD